MDLASAITIWTHEVHGCHEVYSYRVGKTDGQESTFHTPGVVNRLNPRGKWQWTMILDPFQSHGRVPTPADGQKAVEEAFRKYVVDHPEFDLDAFCK